MGQITAEIVAHSRNEQGDELVSVLVTFPRIILSEMNTHRMLSKNTSSSRAIPFNKMVESVQNDPFIPIAWQKEHKGMQGSEYFTDKENDLPHLKRMWLCARDNAIETANTLNKSFENKDGSVEGVTKQLCNRLLEPFMWTTMLITGPKSGWDNFFNLRCPSYETETGIYKSKKDAGKYAEYGTVPKYFDDIIGWLQLNKGQAEIHIMDLAEKIYDAMNESTPKQLEAGQWHIPFEDKIKEITRLRNYINLVKISTAMAARTSYTVVGEEKDIDYEKMIELHDRLLTQDPPHSSPMEHCARSMSNEEYVSFIKGNLDAEIDADGYIDISTHINNHNSFGWCRNFKGFIPYRHIIETK